MSPTTNGVNIGGINNNNVENHNRQSHDGSSSSRPSNERLLVRRMVMSSSCIFIPMSYIFHFMALRLPLMTALAYSVQPSSRSVPSPSFKPLWPLLLRIVKLWLPIRLR